MVAMPIQARAADQEVLVFAAASLKNALDDVIAAYGKEHGTKVTASYAASSALAKQIEQGAPAQLFISADLDWMDYLARAPPDRRRHAQEPPGQQPGAGGRPRTASSARSRSARASTSPSCWATAGSPWATSSRCPPASTPRRRSRSWAPGPASESKLAQSENVRAALALVAHGEAPLGIVYKTDAASDPSVKIVGTFPADSHPPIIYPVAVTKAGERQQARRPSSSSWPRPAPGPRSRSRASRLIGPAAS